jgi:hypothetical protein
VKRLVAIGALLALTGCAPDISALANDKNQDCVQWSTPWGSGLFSRNGGCPVGLAISAPSVPAAK